MSGLLVRADRVSVSRRGIEILKEVSIEVGEGDFVSVIGPNGAGKTTLLKVVAGILAPDSGMCERRRGLRMGYMPQSIERMDFMPVSAERFIRLRHRGSGARFGAVCRETGIGGFLKSAVNDLSGGEIQRVLLARALMNVPDLLVLDEPAQNLDVSGQLAFYKLLEKIRRERGIAVLMVSHDLHMVMSSTNRVVCLYKHVCCAGEPKAVAKVPEFVSMFGEDMARLMSFYDHSHDHTHGQDAGDGSDD